MSSYGVNYDLFPDFPTVLMILSQLEEVVELHVKVSLIPARSNGHRPIGRALVPRSSGSLGWFIHVFNGKWLEHG